LPMIDAQAEPSIYHLIRAKAAGLGASVLALNGIADHVHLVASVPPRVAVADFIGQVKGATSARYNQAEAREMPLVWQDEYGVFSFDAKRVPHLVAYVEKQKEHHLHNQLIRVLERTDEATLAFVQESQGHYLEDEAAWWREMETMDDQGLEAL
ncbi:MAG: transposase, partial [Anaerolineales bacterium]